VGRWSLANGWMVITDAITFVTCMLRRYIVDFLLQIAFTDARLGLSISTIMSKVKRAMPEVIADTNDSFEGNLNAKRH
jgi:hypothetical protein